MKGRISMILALFMVLVAASCQRRDFADRTTAVDLKIRVNTHIDNVADVQLPDLMKISLYDPNTGKQVFSDYVGPEGGIIRPAPGVYDLVVHSVASESTQIRNESEFDKIEAYSSEVSAYLKGQLSKFLASIAKSKAERAMTKTSEESKAPEDEKVVYEPDHFFAGTIKNVNIPVVYEGDAVQEIVISIDVHSVVETWKVSIPNVNGMEWVMNAVAIMSGQVESHYFGKGEDSEKSVSIYFEMKKDESENALVAYFNTFGKHPSFQSILSLDINVTDTGGSDHHYHFDVDSQFYNNPESHIIVEQEVEVEEPAATGGGFNPTVDDWEEIRTDINL